MGNPLPGGVFDNNADSYGRYGANAGIKRLSRILEDTGVSANILTSGVLAAKDPEQVSTLAAAGHEIVGHGFAQDLIPPLLSPADDEESIAKSTRAITNAIGRQPRGWISPRATSGDETRRRLVQHGYRWHFDALDADLPYIQRFPEGDLLAIPLSVEFNDLPHAMRFGRTPQQFVDMFHQALPHLLAAKADVVVVDVMVHAHCYGRPASAWALREIAASCVDRSDIWVATRGKIADHIFNNS
ncbi:polysaccharide deacetylase family protein [Burkholderia sp. Ax-1719]|nr:polysaccharide deacetylase family protein [Burkholderia sp. Ax-1719]